MKIAPGEFVRTVKKLTYRDYAAMPEEEGVRYQIFDGVLTLKEGTGSLHQIVIGELICQIGNALLESKFRYLSGPLDVRFAQPGEPFDEATTVLQPDFLVYLDFHQCVEVGGNGCPDFVIEVLSRGGAKNDFGRKRDIYEAFGAKEYWIIDATHRVLFVHARSGNLFAAVQIYEFDTLLPVNSVPGLSIDLVQLARTLDRAERLIDA